MIKNYFKWTFSSHHCSCFGTGAKCGRVKPVNWISNGSTDIKKDLKKNLHRLASTQKDHTLLQKWMTT
jgi:hypothetical protein